MQIRLREADKSWMNMLLTYPTISAPDSLKLLHLFGHRRSYIHHVDRIRQLSGAVDNAPDSKNKTRPRRNNGLLLSWHRYSGPAYAAEDGEGYSHAVYMHSLTPYGARVLGAAPHLPRRDERGSVYNHYQTAFLVRVCAAGVPLDAVAPALPFKKINNIQDRIPMSLVISSGNIDYAVAFVVSGREMPDKNRYKHYNEYACTASLRKKGSTAIKYVILVPWSQYSHGIAQLADTSYETHILPYEYAPDVLSALYADPECYIKALAAHLGAASPEYNYSGISPFRYRAILNGEEIYLNEFVSGDLRTLRELKKAMGRWRVNCLILKEQLKRLSKADFLLPQNPNINYFIY